MTGNPKRGTGNVNGLRIGWRREQSNDLPVNNAQHIILLLIFRGPWREWMIVEVKVVPNSREFRITREGTGWKVCLTQPAERNKANIELVKEMEKITGRRVRILRGGSGRKKVLEIEGQEKENTELLANAQRP
ncbi:DUF167 domain-containing protein [Candidatus Micrarchaeota archaeon]|nr:DUF167 domain-containing protein [Candidatus Micrarchaeota archaeon]